MGRNVFTPSKVAATVRGAFNRKQATGNKKHVIHDMSKPLFNIMMVPHMHLDRFFRKTATGENWLALMVRLRCAVHMEAYFNGLEDIPLLAEGLRTMYLVENRFIEKGEWSTNFVELASISLAVDYSDTLQQLCVVEELTVAFRKAAKEMENKNYYL